MSHPIIRFLDRAKETTTTTGSGTISLGGAVAGFVGISGVGNGNSTYYTLQEGNNFEVGIGTYATTGNTLSRDEVFSSSNSDDSKIDLAGSTTVFITYPADKAVTQTSGNYVGIGIDPEYQLQVSGTGSFNTVRWSDGTTQTTAASGGGAPTDAQYVTLASDGDLSAERVLTASTGIHIADGGANGPVWVSASGSTTAQSGIVRLQDSATDGTTDRAITPNAVYDISGVLSTSIASTGSTNAASIATNTSNISTNTTNIASTGATNAAAILANTSNISTNTTNIASTGATNAAAAATNATNISTNTTNIASTGATNAASIATVSGLLPSPGGSDTQIQFNDGGSFGGDSGLIWHKTHNLLTVNGTGVFDRIGVGTDSPTYELDVAGDIGVDEYLYHNGDGDTYLRLRDNNINLVAGGKSALILNYSTGKIQLNNSNADLDVQIMADNGEVILHTDAGKNQVGIGTNSPDAMVDILCANDTDRGLKIEMTASGSVNPFEIVHSDGSPRFSIDTAGDISCGAFSGSGANFILGREDISATLRVANLANNFNIRNTNADKNINIDVAGGHLVPGEVGPGYSGGCISFREYPTGNAPRDGVHQGTFLEFAFTSGIGTGMYIRSRDDGAILTQWLSYTGLPVAMVNATGAISGQHFIFGDGTTQSTASAGGSSYTAGTGLSLDGTEFNVSGIDSTMIVDGTVSNTDLANSSITITAGTGLSNGGAVSLGGTATLDADVGTTSVSGIVRLQDSATDGTTDRAITPNAVYDISGVLSTSIAATGATNAAAIAAKDNYQYWTITDGSNTSNLQTTEDVKITGAGQVTVTLASGNPNVVTVSGAAGGGGGSPGGSDTQVQFNDSTSFGGDSDLTWNKTTNVLTVAGHIAATTKSFLIDHPVKENKRLQYASLEGPENGVYVRGHTTSHVIELPYYWVALVDPESITVHLTAKGKPQPSLCVNRVSANKVYLSCDQHISAYYTVSATRKDVPPLEVEI
jgi:hypothetical protein